MSQIDRVTGGKSYHEIAVRGKAPAPEESPAQPRDEVQIGGPSRGAREATPLAKSVPLAAAPAEGAPKKWTVLYYFCGNNNISRDMLVKAARMEQTGSTERMNVVIQTGQPQESPYPGATRFQLQKAPQMSPDEPAFDNEDPYRVYGDREKKDAPYQKLFSTPVERLGSVDMSDPKALKDFVAWGMKSYPAEHYMVVLMDHGYGFMGTLQDDASNRVMSLPEVESAIKGAQRGTGRKVDILGLDSCLMGQAEAAYQLKGAAKFLVASEEVEYPFGWPEGNIVSSLDGALKKGDVSASDAARLIVEEGAKEPDVIKTLSAIDLKSMTRVKDAMDGLAGSLLATAVPKETIRKLIEETHNYCTVLPDDKLCTSYRDIYDFAERLVKSADVPDERVKKSAAAVLEAVSGAVLAETHRGEGKDGSHGIAAYLPSTGFLPEYEGFIPENKGPRVRFPAPSERYGELAFARDSLWDELLRSLRPS